MFESIVHQCDRFDFIQKLWILKNCLVDDEDEILRDTSIEQGAYCCDARAEVKQIYDNKRAIIGLHFADLFDLKFIRNESEIREGLRKVSAFMRGLEVHDTDDEAMSPIFTHIVLNKLESEIRHDFEKSLKYNDHYSSFEELSAFLKSLSLAYEGSASMRKSKKRKITVSRKGTFNSHFLSKPTNQCLACNGSHPLTICENFRICLSKIDSNSLRRSVSVLMVSDRIILKDFLVVLQSVNCV